MNKISHLGARLCWLSFGILMGGYRMIEGVQHGSVGMLVSASGWLLLGVLWFLSPLIIGRANGMGFDKKREAALGSDGLRTKLLLGAVACVFLGMVLRSGFGM